MRASRRGVEVKRLMMSVFLLAAAGNDFEVSV